MAAEPTSKDARTSAVLTASVGALTAVLASLVALLPMVTRERNSFMLAVIVASVAVIAVTEGVFLGKVVSLRRTPR